MAADDRICTLRVLSSSALAALLSFFDVTLDSRLKLNVGVKLSEATVSVTLTNTGIVVEEAAAATSTEVTLGRTASPSWRAKRSRRLAGCDPGCEILG